MSKIFLFMVTSVDGYFEGPDHDITWHMVDDEFNEFAVEQMNNIDTLLFGRKTYELMEGYWPKLDQFPDITKEDLQIGKIMTDLPKVVVTHQDLKTDWNNVRVVNKNVNEEVKKLKERDGKDIAIFGSNNLCVSLMQDGQVDEFRIMVNPVAIGAGNALFTGIQDKVNLKFVGSRAFGNGNILLTYQPA